MMVLHGLINAQTVTTPDLNKSLIPPSPDAASLGKFGIFPVTLYTGTPNISVPVTEIKSAKLSFPVSLAYNYNGYRPGEEASWVGLGWTMQSTGVITRVVKGKVDESSLYPSHWKDYPNILSFTNNMNFMANVGVRNVDTEPDVYIFNFNGHSGKFIMVGSRAFVMPYQNLQINQVGNGFTIIAEDGVRYSFQDMETTTPNNSANPGIFTPPYTSAWYLTTMISADATDTISFRYTSWSHRQYSGNYSETYQQQVGWTKGGSACTGSNSACDTWSAVSYPGAYITAKRLTGISCRNSLISFIPEDTARKDFNSTTAYALKEIDIYNRPNNTLLKKINLVHGYFNDASGNPSQLKLSGVSLRGYYVNSTIGSTITGDSIVLPNYYSFQYNNEGGAFPKNTKGIDKFGFYNGYDNNYSLFDASIVNYTPVMPTGIRSVNTSACMNGILTKLVYPTGGYTSFNYESNLIGTPGSHVQESNKESSLTVTYNPASGNPNLGYGVFQTNEAQTIRLTFGRDISNYPFGVVNNYPILNIYGPGGNGDSIISPLPLIYTSPHLNKALSSQTDTLTIQPGTYSYKVSCESTSISAYAIIDYKTLDTTFYAGDPGPGLRISSIQSFDNINSTTPAITKTYRYGIGSMLANYGYGGYSVNHSGCNYYTENITTSDYSSPLATLLSDQFYYPTVTEINHDASGAGKTTYAYGGDGTDALAINLTSQTDSSYNSAGIFTAIKRKVNNYARGNMINFWAFTYNLSKVADVGGCAFIPPLASPDQLDTIDRWQLYQAIPYVWGSSYMQLASTDEISYDQNGANPLTVHTDYYYDNPNYLQPGRKVAQNSKGQSFTTQTKYPLDYNINGCTSLYSVDTTFKSARDAADLSYQICISNRYNAAIPYWSGSIPNSQNTALLNALRGYPCENNTMASWPSVISNMVNGISSYYSCLNNYFLPDSLEGITMLQKFNEITTPVEQIVSINKNGTDYLFGATKTDFTAVNLFASSPKTLYETPFTATSILKSDFLANPNSYYLPRVNFKYDVLDNLVEQSKINDIKTAYIWDYNKMYPIAQAANADTGSIAYTSFESNGNGNWTIPSGGIVSGGITGSNSYNLANGAVTRGGLTTSRTYTVSYWLNGSGSIAVSGAAAPVSLFAKNGWTYYQTAVTGVSSTTVSGAGIIDELRLYPPDAQMTTYTYDPLVGITTSCSPNNTLSFYEYDPLGRLKDIRDADRNILKQVDYKYQFATRSYGNQQLSGTYTRNNCGPGYTGGTYTTIVYANTFFAATQPAADQLARDSINSSGQNNANTYGACTPVQNIVLQSYNYVAVDGFVAVYTNTSTNQQFSFAIPTASGPQTLGTIPAGTYNLTISKPGNTSTYLFSAGCNYNLSGQSATFSNIAVSTTSCNIVSIDTLF